MKLTKNLLGILRCPNCGDKAVSLEVKSDHLLCPVCNSAFPVVANRPVMLRYDNAVFQLEGYREPGEKKFKRSGGWIARLIPDPSVNLSRTRVLERLKTLLAANKPARVLIVGSGRQRSQMDMALGAGDGVQVICSDIDTDADVDLFCDGHDLPFINCSFDAVVTTVVLEHVLYPERVAAEIHRVLKPSGFLYSEMPFMQQVHEGAYDFTRYSLSGHRRLFNGFSELESGMVAGPATTLVWSIENFVLAFVSQPKLRLVVKALVRLAFAWLKHIDRFLEKRPEAMDGASCTYFLGTKMNGRVADDEIIARYVGAKHMSHV
ncbi:MAG: methyltransferase domain-containing protein [Thiobacillus sp.]